jgi:site-specific recombinase XerD
MKHIETRLKNGKVTKHRVVCVRQFLRCLEKFAEEMRNPAITELVDIYNKKFENWRDKSLTRLTNNPLSPRTCNKEYNSHRQFFGFLVDKKIIGK